MDVFHEEWENRDASIIGRDLEKHKRKRQSMNEVLLHDAVVIFYSFFIRLTNVILPGLVVMTADCYSVYRVFESHGRSFLNIF